jgi:RNA polymerase sigma-70 factor (ECF subfamily)
MQAREDRLRSLMLQGLAGDASSYHTLLIELSAHLRSFLRRRLGRYPEEVEDLVQELLFAIHTQRQKCASRSC